MRAVVELARPFTFAASQGEDVVPYRFGSGGYLASKMPATGPSSKHAPRLSRPVLKQTDKSEKA